MLKDFWKMLAVIPSVFKWAVIKTTNTYIIEEHRVTEALLLLQSDSSFLPDGHFGCLPLLGLVCLWEVGGGGGGGGMRWGSSGIFYTDSTSKLCLIPPKALSLHKLLHCIVALLLFEIYVAECVSFFCVFKHYLQIVIESAFWRVQLSPCPDNFFSFFGTENPACWRTHRNSKFLH